MGLVLNARTSGEELSIVVDECRALGAEATAVLCDVADLGEAK